MGHMRVDLEAALFTEALKLSENLLFIDNEYHSKPLKVLL